MQTAKYLGVYYHYRLKWEYHIKKQTEKVRKLIMMTRSSLGQSWGPSPYLLHWCYKQCLRPIFTYACFIWGKGFTGKLVEKADSFQRQALMQCGNFREKTPTQALNVILGVPPIKIFVNELITKTHLRFKFKYTSLRVPPADNGHWNYSEELFQPIGHDLDASDFCNIKRPPAGFGVDLEFDAKKSITNSNVVVYTDGSKSDSNVGCAAVLYDYNESQIPLLDTGIRLSENSTVYQSELYGIISACRLIRHKYDITNKQTITIYTDNQSVLYSLQSRLFTSKTAVKARLCLDFISKFHDINLSWVKGHTGQLGNEEADRLAREYSTNNNIPIHNTHTATAIIYADIERHYRVKWNEFWVAQKLGQSKLWFPQIDPDLHKYLFKYTKVTFSRMVRFLTGFAHLRRMNKKMYPAKYSTNKCRLCGQVPERATHIVWECDALATERLQILNTLPVTNPVTPWDPHAVKSFLALDIVRRLEDDDDADNVMDGGSNYEGSVAESMRSTYSTARHVISSSENENEIHNQNSPLQSRNLVFDSEDELFA